jgi:hypothetical protein
MSQMTFAEKAAVDAALKFQNKLVDLQQRKGLDGSQALQAMMVPLVEFVIQMHDQGARPVDEVVAWIGRALAGATRPRHGLVSHDPRLCQHRRFIMARRSARTCRMGRYLRPRDSRVELPAMTSPLPQAEPAMVVSARSAGGGSLKDLVPIEGDNVLWWRQFLNGVATIRPTAFAWRDEQAEVDSGH